MRQFKIYTDVFSVTSIDLLISDEALPLIPIIKICDTDAVQDGFAVFNLSTQVTDIIAPILPNRLQISYYANQLDALLQQNLLSNNFANTTAYSQTIYGRIINGSDCYGIVTVKLEVKSFPNLTPTKQVLCEKSSTALSFDSGYTSYL